MDKYISISEAVTTYGKSISSIRRIVKELKETDLTQLEFTKLKNGTEKILISKHYLDMLFSNAKTTTSNSYSATTSNDLVTFLKEQLITKDKQIENLTQLLAIKEQQNQTLLELPKNKSRWFWSR